MKKFINYNLLAVILISLMAAFSSCKEETYNPQITAVNSTNEDIATSGQGYPGDLLIVEGLELNEMKSIAFVADGGEPVEVVFNPALNSDKAVMFYIPFNEDLGSKFGTQQIVFTNKQGKSISQTFEILQPLPEINNFDPERPKAGDDAVIVGQWFQNLISVTFEGAPIEYTQISSTRIAIQIPSGFEEEEAEIGITTSVGTSTNSLAIDAGFNIYLFNDFDGGGFFEDNNWWNNGDITDPVVFSDINGISGNYAQIVWNGSTANGWGNAHASTGATAFMSETNADTVYFVIDIYCYSAVSTGIEFLVDDGVSNWAYRHVFTADQVNNWVTLKLKLSDFGFSYNPDDQGNGDPNPATITQVKISIPEWMGIVPTAVRIDNISFHEYY